MAFTTSVNAEQKDGVFLSVEEIENATLNDYEKGMAFLSLSTAPILTCSSGLEGSNSLTTQVRITRLDFGVTVTTIRIKLGTDVKQIIVGANELNPSEISALIETKNELKFHAIATDEEQLATPQVTLVLKFDGSRAGFYYSTLKSTVDLQGIGKSVMLKCKTK
jgi:hypothetical protein